MDAGYFSEKQSLDNSEILPPLLKLAARSAGGTSITATGDFDNDGNMDYVVGNLGGNSFYKASDQYPVSIYAKDFYNQGIVQCMLTSFIKDRQGGLKKGV